MMRLWFPAAIALAVSSLAGCAQPRVQSVSMGAGNVPLSAADVDFVTRASRASAAEIATGELAQRLGGSYSVRQFGALMLRDHGMANAELAVIANRSGIVPSQDADAQHHANAQMLMRLNGPEFDRQYAAHMVKDHEAAVALFEKQSASGYNVEITQFATKNLPVLREHLRMARALPGPQ